MISNHEVCKYYWNSKKREYPIKNDGLGEVEYNDNLWDIWREDILNIPHKPNGWGNVITYVQAAKSKYPKDMYPGWKS